MKRLIGSLLLVCMVVLPAQSGFARGRADRTFYLRCFPRPVNRLDAEVFVSYMDVKPTASPTPSPCGSSEVGLVGRIDWAAATGVPVVLDATSKAVGQIDVVGPFSSTTLEIELVGTVAGKERPLGAAVTSPLSGPAGVFTFEITLSRALDGRKITDLHLITTVEDSSAPLPAFGLNSSSSFLNLPTIPEVNHG